MFHDGNLSENQRVFTHLRTELVAMFASNPSSLNLDNVIDGIMRSNTLNNIATEGALGPVTLKGDDSKNVWPFLCERFLGNTCGFKQSKCQTRSFRAGQWSPFGTGSRGRSALATKMVAMNMR